MPCFFRSFIIAVFALAGQLWAQGPFVPPGEGPVVFRRDRIPLDIESIRQLSFDLKVMAETVDGDEAEGRRLVAQCIALSLALEPSNRATRRLLEEWEQGEARRPRDLRHANEALGHGLELLEWLQSEEAGRDAWVLAACLKDVMSQVGVGDPRCEKLRSGGELGKWDGWVPRVEAYQEKEVEVPPVVVEPPSGPNSDAPFKLLLEQASVTVPMWYPNANAQAPQPDQAPPPAWVLKPDRMSMTAKFSEDRRDQPFALRIGGSGMLEQLGDFNRQMEGILASHHKKLPNGLEVDITSTAFEDAMRSNKDQSVSAVAVVLASAAITAHEPTGIVIGAVDKEGNYILPSDFWAKLKCFGKGQGQRIVLPEEAKDQMASLLVMGKPEYFMEYEVLTASNVDELLNATSSVPDSGLAEACEMFAVIQEAAKGNNIRTFIANSHVKKRLQEVVNASPKHLSAALLLDQSMGKRPTYLSRKVLAAELLAALEPVSQVSAVSYDEALEWAFKVVPAGKIYEECRKQVDVFDRLIDRQDREMYKQVLDALDLLRDYGRVLESRGSADEKAGPISRSSREVVRVYDMIRGELAKEAGG